VTRRALAIIPVLLVASIIIFVAMRVVPGDPLTILAQGQPVSEARRAELTALYNLDKPLLEQYAIWLAGALQGDLGPSLKTGEPVGEIILRSLPRSLLLLLGAFIIAQLISIPLGITAALREGRLTDQLIISVTLVLFSIPLFISSVIAIWFFAFQFGLLPAFGTGLESGDPADVFRHMILPWCVLAVALLAVQTATLRAGLVDSLHQEYVLMARGRGLPFPQVLRRHAMRSALVPVVTLLGLQLSYMLVGSVYVDYIFGLGGFGTVLVNAVNFRDLPLVQGCVLVVAVFFSIANLGVDIVAGRLDPRYAVR
jgi:peptide/nickel transport system permease protein